MRSPTTWRWGARASRCPAVSKSKVTPWCAAPRSTSARSASSIAGSYPVGTPGRADYLPKDDPAANLGDRLVAAGNGVKTRGKPPLPEGWTGESLIALGEEVRQALAVRDQTAQLRGGTANAVAALTRMTGDMRKTLRGLVINWFGASDARLLPFGINPRRPTGGGRRKKTAELTPQLPPVA